MPNNTRARSNELNALAAEIVARENIDFDNLTLEYYNVTRPRILKEIVERGKCHIETARTVWNRQIAQKKWGLGWGGTRPGSGRKPTPRPPDK